MKYAYVALTNFLLFFFIYMCFRSVMKVGNQELTDYLIAAALFGLLMGATPKILEFMKVKESPGALILVGVVATFIFYFIGYYALDLFTLSRGAIKLNNTTEIITVEDQTVALIMISLFSSIFSVILSMLNTKQKASKK